MAETRAAPQVTIGAVALRGQAPGLDAAALARTVGEALGHAVAARGWPGGPHLATLRLRLEGTDPAAVQAALDRALGGRHG